MLREHTPQSFIALSGKYYAVIAEHFPDVFRAELRTAARGAEQTVRVKRHYRQYNAVVEAFLRSISSPPTHINGQKLLIKTDEGCIHFTAELPRTVDLPHITAGDKYIAVSFHIYLHSADLTAEVLPKTEPLIILFAFII